MSVHSHESDACSKLDCEKSATDSESHSSDNNKEGDDDINTIKDQLTKSETKLVFRLRSLVILVLLLAGAGVSVTTYLIPHSASIAQFETQYAGAALQITSAFNAIFQEIATISLLGIQVSNYAVDNGTISWPSVTVSNFQSRASGVRTLSGALYVSVNPVVAADELAAWEDYVQGGANYWM